jgi:hypothetical protein
MLNRNVGPKREQAIRSWRHTMRKLIIPHKVWPVIANEMKLIIIICTRNVE